MASRMVSLLRRRSRSWSTRRTARAAAETRDSCSAPPVPPPTTSTVTNHPSDTHLGMWLSSIGQYILYDYCIKRYLESTSTGHVEDI